MILLKVILIKVNFPMLSKVLKTDHRLSPLGLSYGLVATPRSKSPSCTYIFASSQPGNSVWLPTLL